jgi:hypothetical protein
MVEFLNPRKATALRTALDWRAGGGNITQLCLERYNDPEFPS